jgi:hypothetical protein
MQSPEGSYLQRSSNLIAAMKCMTMLVYQQRQQQQQDEQASR